MTNRSVEERDRRKRNLGSLEDCWKRKRGKMEKEKESVEIEEAFRRNKKVLR